jgi:hypothetical protein
MSDRLMGWPPIGGQVPSDPLWSDGEADGSRIVRPSETSSSLRMSTISISKGGLGGLVFAVSSIDGSVPAGRLVDADDTTSF